MWKMSSSKVNRFLSILICFVICVVITVVGVLTPLSSEEVYARKSALDELRGEILNLDVHQMTWLIFANNFRLCLMMFIPAAGLLIGGYVLYNTGLFISAESSILHMSGSDVFFSLFLFPFTWLEFTAYATAFAANFWLIWRVIQGEWRREVSRTALLIGISGILLLVGALVEAFLIVSLQ